MPDSNLVSDNSSDGSFDALETNRLKNVIPDNNLSLQADEDYSYNRLENQRLSNLQNNNTDNSSVTSQVSTYNSSFAGATTAGTAQNTDQNNVIFNTSRTGRRRYNPLTNFSSYTYNLTLYMLKPETYAAFVAGGKKNLDALTNASDPTKNGVFVVAKSGGVDPTINVRAPGIKYDYYLDNLKFKSFVAGNQSNTDAVTTEFSFDVIEPYGFSFISQLNNASSIINSTSNLDGADKIKVPTKQFFILKIAFTGYDRNGNVVTNKDIKSYDSLNASASSNELFESYYDLYITSIKFKLNGKATIYNVQAASIGTQVGFGIKKGRIDRTIELYGATVEETLMDLENKLNNIQDEYLKATGPNGTLIDKKNTYKIIFRPNDESVVPIKTGLMASPANKNKTVTAVSNAKASDNVNESTAVNTTDNLTRIKTSISRDTSIIQAISTVITLSSYLEDKLNYLKTVSKDNESVDNKKPENFSWFNVSAEVVPKEWDDKIKDWSYYITYIIQPYEAPMVITPYTSSSNLDYYGPHKRYSYWFTGENTEIISYEQKLDNAWYMPTNDGGGNTPLTQAIKPTGDPTGRLDQSKQSQNSTINQLYDPGSWVAMNLEIAGDPDYLVQDSISSLNTLYNKYYGVNDYSINPTSGQVFIEIDFKEPEDYSNQNGLMTINRQLAFWEYPDYIKGQIQGISYRLVLIENRFSQGKFTQHLSGVVNTFPEDPKGTTNPRNSEQTANTSNTDVRQSSTDSTNNSTSSGQNSGNTTGYVQYTGLTEQENFRKNEIINQSSYDLLPTGASLSQVETTAPTGANNQIVQDDDASGINSSSIQTVDQSYNGDARLA